MRGGFVGIQVAVVLQSDAWPDLPCAALGAWVRIRATAELTGEPVGRRAIERLRIAPEDVAELVAVGLLTEADGRYEAVGMPEYRYPSDSPEARRERQAASRAGMTVEEWRASHDVTPSPAPSPVNSNQLRSTQGDSPSLVTLRNGALPDDDDHHAEEFARSVCARCHRPAAKGHPLRRELDGSLVPLYVPCPGTATA
jgi:hypothetical protein